VASKRRQKRPSSLLPKGKRERRRAELLGGSALGAVTLLIVLAFFAASFEPLLIGLPQTAAVVSAVLTDLANGDRASNNLSSLTVNPLLVTAAQAKADDMAAKGYFAHVAPDGKDPWYWFKGAGYHFQYAGENLAVDFSDSMDVEHAWMNSPTHRENILDAHYTEIGIATAIGTYQGHQTIFVVQEFGAPLRTPAAAAQAIATSSIPTTPTKVATAVAPKPRTIAQKPQTSASPATTTSESTQVLGTEAPTNNSSMTISVQPFSPTYVAATPRHSLQYFYYAIAVLLILALAYTTRFEMRLHHLRHVRAVTVLIVFMGVLVLSGNYLFFSQPTLAIGQGITQTL
jgi:uncharacterized protein YkwD